MTNNADTPNMLKNKENFNIKSENVKSNDIFSQFGEEIVKWNKENLPKNTLWMQVDKVKEEFSEFWMAKDTDIEEHIYEEAADVIISIIGLNRFGYDELMRYEQYMFMICLSLSTSKLKKAIRQKLDILKTRKYEIVNNVYRHVEK